MSDVVKVDRSSFDTIYSLLSRSQWGIPKATWRNLFEPAWQAGGIFCGYALVDSDKTVGFISTIFSQRKTKTGEIIKTCGLSAWFVDDQYRSESLKLLKPVLAMKDHVLINLTASKRVYEISKSLGFNDFENYEICIFPRIDLIAFFRRSKVFVTTKENKITTLLNNDDLLIYKDHNIYNYGHLVLYSNSRHGDYCYLVYKQITRKRLPAIRIDYISNKDLFVRYLGNIMIELFKERLFLFLIVDSRQIAPHRVFLSIKSKLKVPRFYRSDHSGSTPTDDNLYSEFVLLDM